MPTLRDPFEMTRRRFLQGGAAALGGALALPAWAAGAAGGERRPNIVLIMADDMGFECVGANGGETYATPNLDRMAREGARFEHSYAQPLCTPSRVKIMTGRCNVRNYTKFGELKPDEITFGQLLKQAGYATCIAGKWQLGKGAEAPRHFGFDEHCLWQLTRMTRRYVNPVLEINGEMTSFPEGTYGPDIVNDYVCDFMRKHREQPFFVYYPMILPHFPFEPTPDSADYDPSYKEPERVRGAGDMKHFVDMVEYVDKMVGRVNATLEELGLADDTLVLFTCDNGSAGGRSRWRGQWVGGGKSHMTDAGTRVPLLASGRGVKPGVECEDLVDFSDFLPTVCAAAGVAVPADRPIDGRSFLPQLGGARGDPRDWIYMWYSRSGEREKAREFARNQRFKLYRSGELYDVPADRGERTPLGPDAGPEAEAARAALQAVLGLYRDARSADLP